MNTNVVDSDQKGQKGQNSTDPHVLAGRLAVGWLICDQERDPTRKQRLEDHWIRLLHDYEAACDRADPRPEQKVSDRFLRDRGGR